MSASCDFEPEQTKRDDDPLSPADVRASLGDVASGLADQLSSITEEMSKIRQELYGDAGIGGITKELEKLRSSGLGDMLDDNVDQSSQGPGGAARRRNPAERDAELEALRRRVQARKSARKSTDAPSTVGEKMVLIFLILVCVYIASPDFRDVVKHCLNAVLELAGFEGFDVEEGVFARYDGDDVEY